MPGITVYYEFYRHAFYTFATFLSHPQNFLAKTSNYYATYNRLNGIEIFSCFLATISLQKITACP